MDVARILGHLEALTLSDLRTVEAKAHELAERIAEWQRPNKRTVETAPAPGGCYRLEYIRCGKCAKGNAGGYHHGPYWYLYRYAGGRTKKTYIGKERP
jgi:hypothetical protein